MPNQENGLLDDTHAGGADETACELPQSFKYPITAKLLAQMTQELRTPLTAILGMASVLNQSIYGPLTEKQKEYVEVIHHSGRQVLALVDEIIRLVALNHHHVTLKPTRANVEIVCQQAVNQLEQTFLAIEPQIRLTVEPGAKTWVLDTEKLSQLVYHLGFSVIHHASPGSSIRIHVARREQKLNLTLWTTHPWLGDGLSQSKPVLVHLNPENPDETASLFQELPARHLLSLMLSQHLAEIQGGTLVLAGSAEAEYRYSVSLP